MQFATIAGIETVAHGKAILTEIDIAVPCRNSSDIENQDLPLCNPTDGTNYRKKRNFISSSSRKWPTTTIPYTIDESLFSK